MNNFLVPKALHEVFGEKQSVIEVVFTALFAVVGTSLIYFHFDFPGTAHTWRTAFGLILIADVLAGCLANFTRGTNQYYAQRPKGRLLFIAIHVHLLVIAWLLSAPMLAACWIWLYTIACALLVNRLFGYSLQVFIAASLLCVGLLLILSLALPGWFLVISIFFMMKVMFSFAVDHYRQQSA
ncbi:hypothetical protein [Photobacterium atrarenae]|uniref:Permease n=1 Tax=Photobacterium atrarenae TaxID=865757 RepID=A0ABY5GNX4_9GAMM|nr:hypothetical protein [Photobacterium atrarenae]UTV30826.1 hypothetical protein NNL38_19915 [Photobacterium atrarenae]